MSTGLRLRCGDGTKGHTAVSIRLQRTRYADRGVLQKEGKELGGHSELGKTGAGNEIVLLGSQCGGRGDRNHGELNPVRWGKRCVGELFQSREVADLVG